MTEEEAIQLVNEKIAKREERLIAITNGSNGPETATVKGYYIDDQEETKEVNASKLAFIMLKHNYATFDTLGREQSVRFWTELAEFAGFYDVESFTDISLEEAAQ